MARRGYIGGSGGDDGDIAALIAARNQQQEDPRLGMAMKLMQLGMSQQQDAAQEARLQRASDAQRLLEQQKFGLSERQQAFAEKSAADTETARKTKEIQDRMDRGATIALEEKKLAADQAEKELARTAAEKKGKSEMFQNLVEHNALKPTITTAGGKEVPNPVYQKRLEEMDPEYARIAKEVAAQQAEESFKTGTAEYRKLTPKMRQKALPEAFGGEENFAKIKAAVEALEPKPNLTPTTAVPPVTPQIAPGAGNYGTGDYGTTSVPTTPSYGVMGTQVIPEATGGITGPVTVPNGPAAPDNFYEEGYPSARPDYMVPGIQTPLKMDVINKYANDPRFTPVEDELAAKVRDWWRGPAGAPQTTEVAPQAEVAPYEMARGQQVVNPEVYMPRGTAPDVQAAAPTEGQPGFMDWLMNLVKSKSDQRELPYTYGNVLPPSQPLPTPVQQRGDIYDILR